MDAASNEELRKAVLHLSTVIENMPNTMKDLFPTGRIDFLILLCIAAATYYLWRIYGQMNTGSQDNVNQKKSTPIGPPGTEPVTSYQGLKPVCSSHAVAKESFQ